MAKVHEEEAQPPSLPSQIEAWRLEPWGVDEIPDIFQLNQKERIGADQYVVMRLGDPFPRGLIPAPLHNPLPEQRHSFVALWIRGDGEPGFLPEDREPVFGRAWETENNNFFSQRTACGVSFPWDGWAMGDVKGFRLLDMLESSDRSFEYRWIRGREVVPSQLLKVGPYTPAITTVDGHDSLGKAHWTRRMSWTANDGEEVSHIDDAFETARFLCRVPKN